MGVPRCTATRYLLVASTNDESQVRVPFSRRRKSYVYVDPHGAAWPGIGLAEGWCGLELHEDVPGYAHPSHRPPRNKTSFTIVHRLFVFRALKLGQGTSMELTKLARMNKILGMMPEKNERSFPQLVELIRTTAATWLRRACRGWRSMCATWA